MLVVNFFAGRTGLGGALTGEIADMFDVYLIPAGYAFSIWGLIYLALACFTVFQALRRHRDEPELNRIGKLFVLINIANALWLVAFHYLYFGVALVLMIVLLVLLIRTALVLDIGRHRAPTGRLVFAHLPFGIYLGWITVATAANVGQTLSSWGWEGAPLTPEIWAVIVFAAIVVISWAISLRRTNLPHAAVLVWALVAISVEYPDVALVSIGAIVAAVLVVAGFIVAVVARRPSAALMV